MIVEAVRLVISDNDRALIPIRATSDGVDLLGQQPLADLRVGVAGMIVVAVENLGQLRVGVLRTPAFDVAVAAAHIKHARGRQPPRRDIAEKFAQPMQMRAGHGIVGHVAEVLRRVVMRNVTFVRGFPRGVIDLMIVALLKPAPVDRAHAVPGDLLNVLAHVGQIEGGVVVRRRRLFDFAAHEGKRQRGEGQVL